ncbi:glucose-1-phosphate thymidylyltransferase [Saccharothrix deserti]|uniref:glucose-1-phosphate thymidylyltransferase n=1 Tax=Saccharothrix deserti TaxID=2593674 RepID=UPI00131B7F92|nr:glucose-1-phosphate thymidylyltransferase [Saccharothrix deserti]
MKALVLSGGAGTRLRPFSHSTPKQLIPVANRPVLEHVLDNIRALGIEDIGIVVGDRADVIADAIGDGARFNARITYLRQDRPLGLAHCVRIARGFLGDDDFVMYLGDNLLPDGVVDIADAFRASRPAAHVVVHKVPDPRAFGVAELDAHGRILQLVEKPQEPRSDLALIGVYFFTRAVHEAVAAIAPSARGELEITDAIQWLLANGRAVTASEYDGYWRDTGRIEDVLACNAHLLGGLRSHVAGEVDAASRVGAGVVIGSGARVVRSRIEGPAIIGPDTLVEDSHVGPNTAVGRGCVLRASRIADSIVLDGAAIDAVPGLSHSLIGKSATVTARSARPEPDTGLRLVLGDHSSVEIAA